jgi:hypothetical protein
MKVKDLILFIEEQKAKGIDVSNFEIQVEQIRNDYSNITYEVDSIVINYDDVITLEVM